MVTIRFENGYLSVPKFGVTLDLAYTTVSTIGTNWVIYYNSKKVISREPQFFQDENLQPFASLGDLQTRINDNALVPYFKAKQTIDPKSNQIANVYVEYDSIDVTPNRTGQYIVEVDFVESYNINGNNFMANLVVSGDLNDTINFLNYEPKEIGGTGENTTEVTTGLTVNSGTDVRNCRRFRFVYDLVQDNNYNFSLQFAGEGANGEATIYRSVITVEHKPNIGE